MGWSLLSGLTVALILSAPVHAASGRDVLLTIVTRCLNPGIPDYCSQCPSPRVGSQCASGRECRETTEVWDETPEFVAIRDIKMCGCPEGFIHGLAIPRTRITGIEDPHRPDGIWSFAWAAAQKRMNDENTFALAVNPKANRQQDQLHLHIVRLLPDARRRFAAVRAVSVQSLDDVWKAAAKKAASLQLANYGILVTKQAEDGFLVLIEEGSPEKLFTQGDCSHLAH